MKLIKLFDPDMLSASSIMASLLSDGASPLPSRLFRYFSCYSDASYSPSHLAGFARSDETMNPSTFCNGSEAPMTVSPRRNLRTSRMWSDLNNRPREPSTTTCSLVSSVENSTQAEECNLLFGCKSSNAGQVSLVSPCTAQVSHQPISIRSYCREPPS